VEGITSVVMYATTYSWCVKLSFSSSSGTSDKIVNCLGKCSVLDHPYFWGNYLKNYPHDSNDITHALKFFKMISICQRCSL
jgi:hypothetical protein